MPRETLELPIRVEHLSILNEDGELDGELEPELDDDALRAENADIDRWASDLLASLPRRTKPTGTLAPSYPARAPCPTARRSSIPLPGVPPGGSMHGPGP
jgi:hypothetical protein